MFPVRDSVQSRSFPAVTVGLIVANIVVFAHEFSLGPAVEGFVLANGVVPARLLHDPAADAFTLVTSMFLHGGLLHLLGNMWFLWIFGDNVEDRLGKLGFVAFYLASGVMAALSQVLLSPASLVPMVGASGAIAGVLGAYARLFPHARVLAALPIFVILQFYELPALVFLGLWFGLQILSSCAGESGVAWWAHIFGFVTGFLLSLLVRRPRELGWRAPPRRRVVRRW